MSSRIWLVTLLVAACDAQKHDEAPRVVTAKQFVSGLPASRTVGESCAAGGADECGLNQLCLHTQPAPTEGWICSLKCRSEEDCPGGSDGRWICGEFYPGHRACVPPPDWQPRAVTSRGAR